MLRPLFYLCGTDGIGKSTAAKQMQLRRQGQYILLQKGLRVDVPISPEFTGYFRKQWRDLSFEISMQADLSIAEFSNDYISVPADIGEEKRKAMHFVTLYCEESVLRRRVYEKWGDQADTVLPGKIEGREITRLDMALLRNRYFKTYHEEHAFENMLLLDTTRLTADETAERLDTYIKEQIRLYHP